MFDGMANPIPCEPPVREMIAVLIPMTSPAEVNQRSAAVSRIDSGVGLQKIAEAIHRDSDVPSS